MITDIGVCCDGIDQPGKLGVFLTINGERFSLDGYVNALVDIRFEKYLADNNITPESETFDKLKYTDAQLKLRKFVKES
jgi:hypothetical protein